MQRGEHRLGITGLNQPERSDWLDEFDIAWLNEIKIMDIINALMAGNNNLRISNGSKWLFFNTSIDKWVTCGRQYGQHKTRTLIETDMQDLAIEKLLEDW